MSSGVPVDDELRAMLRHRGRTSSPRRSSSSGTSPVPMEPRGILAHWQPRLREFRIWVSTQSPHDVRTVASRITGVPEHQVRVTMGDVGGGFGQKAYLARDEQVIILASHLLGLPLKWIEDRRENLVAATTVAHRALHRHDRGRRRRTHPRHVDGAARRRRAATRSRSARVAWPPRTSPARTACRGTRGRPRRSTRTRARARRTAGRGRWRRSRASRSWTCSRARDRHGPAGAAAAQRVAPQ